MSLRSGLKQVYHIDIETWKPCGGRSKIIASIEDPAVIKTIFAHLEKTSRTPATRTSPPAAKHNTFSPSEVVFP